MSWAAPTPRRGLRRHGAKRLREARAVVREMARDRLAMILASAQPEAVR